MFQRILVPVDGSDRADRAAEYALELAERHNSQLYALYVIDTQVYGEPALSSTESVLTDLEDRGSEVLSDIAERAEYRAIDVTTRRCHGDPASKILEYAEDNDIDVIVMGAQGTTHRDAVGSIASRVLRESSQPVLTV